MTETPSEPKLTAAMSDPDLKAWHARLAGSSWRSADGRVYRLLHITKWAKVAPAELVRMGRDEPKKLTGILENYVAANRKRGIRASTLIQEMYALKSWMSFNEVAFAGYPQMRRLEGVARLGERIPSHDELRRIVDAITSHRGKVTALLMAHSGLRPGSIGIYRGGSALRLRNLPDLDVRNRKFRRTPFQIIVPGEISKNGKSYITFGTPELADKIVEYLRFRVGTHVIWRVPPGEQRPKPKTVPGEKLNPDSPLITGETYATLGQFVDERALMKEVREGIRLTAPKEVQWVPYILRSFASTRLWEASQEGLIDFETREAFLGHDAGVAKVYASGRKLSEESIERLRKTYERASVHLTGKPQAIDVKGELDKILTLAIAKAKSAGQSVDALEAMRQGLDSSKGKSAAVPADPAPATPAHRPVQRLASLEEARELMASGWSVVCAASPGQLVLNSPPA
jgi:hypothetical protein